MQRWLALAAAAACVLVLGGCAALAPRPEPPQVRSAQARVIVFAFPRVRLGIDLIVNNPNPADLEISALDMAITIEGESVASAVLAAPVTLPREASAALALEASGHLGAALNSVARRLGKGGGPLRYELAGHVQLRDGATHAFRRAGILAHL